MPELLPIRGCAFCLRGFRPKRRWQRFCSTSCRDTAKKDDKQLEYVCEYCGIVGDTVDHVPPTSIRPMLVTLGLDSDFPFIVVRACFECNTALGDRAYWTIDTRRSYIASWLRNRYAEYLTIPDWNKTELNALSINLRQMTIQGLAIRDLTKRRIERATGQTSTNVIVFETVEASVLTSNCAQCCKRCDGFRYCSTECQRIYVKRMMTPGERLQARIAHLERSLRRLRSRL